MKTYFCYIDYFATGEGWSKNISLETAKSKKEALERHRKRLRVDDYFLKGTAVLTDHPRNRKIIEQVLRQHFSETFIANLLSENQGRLFFGVVDFSFQSYINRS